MTLPAPQPRARQEIARCNWCRWRDRSDALSDGPEALHGDACGNIEHVLGLIRVYLHGRHRRLSYGFASRVAVKAHNGRTCGAYESDGLTHHLRVVGIRRLAGTSSLTTSRDLAPQWHAPKRTFRQVAIPHVER